MHALLAIAAATAASFATPALARTPADPRVEVVRFADLDLGNPAGIAKLDRRIRTAVAAACGPISDSDPAGKNRARDCRTATAARVRTLRDRAIAAAMRAVPAELASAH
ncbi:MAG: hypothetical protein JWP15_3531 [Alphaproteobacteria bacterium]|nr:hypothetical protein [Alphaproteobacteria bacterium]